MCSQSWCFYSQDDPAICQCCWNMSVTCSAITNSMITLALVSKPWEKFQCLGFADGCAPSESKGTFMPTCTLASGFLAGHSLDHKAQKVGSDTNQRIKTLLNGLCPFLLKCTLTDSSSIRKPPPWCLEPACHHYSLCTFLLNSTQYSCKFKWKAHDIGPAPTDSKYHPSDMLATNRWSWNTLGPNEWWKPN